MSSATTMTSTYRPSGEIDLSDFDNELIISVSNDFAINTSQTFQLGLDRDVGVINIESGKGVFISGSNTTGGMKADVINITNDVSSNNGITAYAPINIEGNSITIVGTTNALFATHNDGGNGDITLKGETVSLVGGRTSGMHAVGGSKITVEAEDLTINAPYIAAQYIGKGNEVVIKAEKGNLQGDVYSGGENGLMSITLNSGSFTGSVFGYDSNLGARTELTLGNDATWVLTDDQQENSQLTTLIVNGTIDMSKAGTSIVVSDTFAGNARIIMDAAGTNILDLSKATAGNSTLTAIASKTADDVSQDQARDMLDRLQGVTEKTGYVEEGMYNGAMTIDSNGNVTVSKNTLMADTLELASASTLSLNRILTNDVRKRLGDIRTDSNTTGVWARFDAGRLNGDTTKTKFGTLQIGGDIQPFTESKLRFGLAASYTDGDAAYTRGSSDFDAYSLAIYGTWMDDSGLFADVIARVAESDSDLSIDGLYTGSLSNVAYSLSTEVGYRFDLNKSIYIEPQLEATYTYIDSDTIELTGSSEKFSYGINSFDSLIGRVGMRVGIEYPDNAGNIYAIASLAHEFLGDATITGANGSELSTNGSDTWLEYGIGANFNLTKNAYVWIDLERTAGALVDEDFRGTIGVRYSF